MEILRQLYPGLPKRSLSLGVEDRLEENYKAMGILLDGDRVSIYINIFATAKVIEELLFPGSKIGSRFLICTNMLLFISLNGVGVSSGLIPLLLGIEEDILDDVKYTDPTHHPLWSL